MVITVSKTIKFIPEFNGNKDLPPADQISVYYKNPTFTLRQRFRGKTETKARADVNGNVEGIDISFHSDDIGLLKGLIEKIENVQYEDGNGTHSINNAVELLEAPREYGGLIDEILRELNKAINSDVPEKN